MVPNEVSSQLRVLLVGDAVGRPGRRALKKFLPAWKRDGRADFIIANGENSAHGKGISGDTASEMFDAGVDVITTGNHVWDNKDVFRFIDDEPRLIRPNNYHPAAEVPGRGFAVFECQTTGFTIGVVNVMGRVMMEPLECPFRTTRAAIAQLRSRTNIIFVDLHAEATSEKVALGWYLDGTATCVFGTHTHVQTADERLLHQGTAFISDLGMTGAHDSVIGMKYETVINRFLRGMPSRFEVAEDNIQLRGALVTVDPDTGRAVSIERVVEKMSAL